MQKAEPSCQSALQDRDKALGTAGHSLRLAYTNCEFSTTAIHDDCLAAGQLSLKIPLHDIPGRAIEDKTLLNQPTVIPGLQSASVQVHKGNLAASKMAGEMSRAAGLSLLAGAAVGKASAERPSGRCAEIVARGQC